MELVIIRRRSPSPFTSFVLGLAIVVAGSSLVGRAPATSAASRPSATRI
jgi:hypothetical protein